MNSKKRMPCISQIWIYNPLTNDNCGALRDLVPFVQFKKREKHPWRSVNFNTKINTPTWVLFTFLKLYKWCQIAKSTTVTNSSTIKPLPQSRQNCFR